VEVAQGIFQIQLPLPFPLKIVHAYALRDTNGWTIVDTGLNYPPAQQAWQAAFAQYGIDPRRIQRIVLTHAHPDHYGMAGWLANMSGAPVLMSPIERAFVRATWLASGAEQHAIMNMFRRYGVPEALLQVVDRDIGEIRELTQPPPPTMVDLLEGTSLMIGERHFRIIGVPGHSDGQLALYCPEDRLLLCGDAVLMKITPNIGLWPWGDANPLATYLATLGRLAELWVDRALPGHGPIITTFYARLQELREHHQLRLQEALQAAGSGTDAFRVCQQLFATEQLTSHQLRFAMAETLAHLEYLVAQQQLVRWQDQAGILYGRSYDYQ
jgi:glyoxylase-like metal-dependent hydrolase (beta-lactamase superfamily II)